MKSTGIIRKVDELGRVVIPIEIRKGFNIVEKDPVEIFVDGNGIVLKKYEPSCMFCENTKNLSEFEGRRICKKCIEKIRNIS